MYVVWLDGAVFCSMLSKIDNVTDFAVITAGIEENDPLTCFSRKCKHFVCTATMDTFGLHFNQLNGYEQNHFQRQRRRWVRTTYGRNFRYHRQGHPFVLMSYNILAQSLLVKHSYLYRRHRAEYLDWSHRLNCLRAEILHAEPAILCLQEVQNTHLMEIENALRPMNYAKPLYKKRTTEEYDDGCAIFHNPELFELVDYQYVEYYQPEAVQVKQVNTFFV